MALENDPYRNPYFRPHRDRELDGFRYADGTQIRRGDPVAVDGRRLRVMGFDSARWLVLVGGPGAFRAVRTDDIERDDGLVRP